MQYTIVYVESDPALRDLTASWLRQHGFKAEVFEDALKAEHYLRLHGAAMVLANQQCRNGTGLNLLSSLRLNGLKLPFVLLHNACDDDTFKEITCFLQGECLLITELYTAPALKFIKNVLPPETSGTHYASA